MYLTLNGSDNCTAIAPRPCNGLPMLRRGLVSDLLLLLFCDRSTISLAPPNLNLSGTWRGERVLVSTIRELASYRQYESTKASFDDANARDRNGPAPGFYLFFI